MNTTTTQSHAEHTAERKKKEVEMGRKRATRMKTEREEHNKPFRASKLYVICELVFTVS